MRLLYYKVSFGLQFNLNSRTLQLFTNVYAIFCERRVNHFLYYFLTFIIYSIFDSLSLTRCVSISRI